MSGHQLTELRRRMCATARAIADTEDRVAGTLERVAITRPGEAVRLRARATQAREFADVERRRADEYGTEWPCSPGKRGYEDRPASGALSAESAAIEDLLA